MFREIYKIHINIKRKWGKMFIDDSEWRVPQESVLFLQLYFIIVYYYFFINTKKY